MVSEKLDIVRVLFGVLGGLAIFIYGMNLMGDGLQKAAGERMRKIISILTGNPLMGVLVGALVTAIIQSSSGTTVMVIGFVSARLMTLPQAIGVIMGANIGTTITAQLIAFKIGHYAYPIAAAGFILFFFFKKKFIKYFGQTVFAFGLLFIGLNIMGDVMKPLVKSPVFTELMMKFNEIPILGLLTGAIMTAIVQSSSAVIAVLQNLASQPTADGMHAAIGLNTAMPILFGSNIGTTVTAIFASIGAKVNAKRAALVHCIFNILGTVVFIWFIPMFSNIVKYISPKGAEPDIISRQIANAHTSFNIANTIIWLPFTLILVKIVNYFIKGEEEEVERRVLYLDYRVLKNPSIAMDIATKEFNRMGQLVCRMMTGAKLSFVNSDKKEIEKVEELEETVDLLQYEITKYLSTMLSQSMLTEHQSIRLVGLMHVAGDIERMGDQCENIVKHAKVKADEQLPFTNEALVEITDAFNKVEKIVRDSMNSLQEGNVKLAKLVISGEDEVDNLEVKLRKSHIERLNNGLCDPHVGITYVELLHNLERIADYSKNVAEAILDDYGCNSKSDNSSLKDIKKMIDKIG
jgi:phosphate:Na+ symporter